MKTSTGSGWWYRLRGVLFRHRQEREILDEMEFHLEQATREGVEAGLSPEEARRRAAAAFGGIEKYRLEAREGHWGASLERTWRDFRFALRSLRHTPAFTALALLTLTLGLGASGAVFSLARTVLLRPLPYPDAERVAWIHTSWKGAPDARVSPAELVDYRERLTAVFEHVGAYAFAGLNVTGSGEPRRLQAAHLTPETFPALGRQPEEGRVFDRREALENAPVALISHTLSQQLFGDGPAVGRELRVDGEATEVIGVLPADFRMPQELYSPLRADVFLPLAFDPESITNRGSHFLFAVARLRDGVPMSRAASALEGLSQSWEQEFPDDYTADEVFRVTALSLPDHLRGPVGPPLMVLVAAVLLVLVLACVNLAGLLLARGEVRSRETAVRLALGASRGRLVAQRVTEALVLAALGGLLGLAFTALVLRGVAWSQPTLPWLGDVSFDLPFLAFTLGLVVVVGLLCGSIPALAVRHTAHALRRGARGVHGSVASHRLRRGLVVAEVALALVLLVGAGLLGRTFQALLAVDPGYRVDSVLTARLDLPERDYPEDADAPRFIARLTDRVAQIPGVHEAGAILNLPLATGLGDMGFEVEGRPIPEGTSKPAADWQVATPGYLDTMALGLERGRWLTDADTADAPGVVVINRTFADLHWPDGDALGARIHLGGEHTRPDVARVVGVVGDVRHGSFTAPARPQMYLAHRQFRLWTDGRPVLSMSLVLHTDPAVPQSEIEAGLRRAVHELNPRLPIAQVQTMEQILGASLAVPRLLLLLMAGFGGVALLLALVGLYGVLSATVERRLPELGLRIALGAHGREIARLVLGQALGMAALGVALGLGVALLLHRGLESQLYGVRPGDPVTLLAMTLVLCATALLAAGGPLRRALRVDPAKLLRAE